MKQEGTAELKLPSSSEVSPSGKLATGLRRKNLFRILHDLGVNDQLPDVIAILCRLVLRRCLLGDKHRFALLGLALLDRPHDLGPDRIVLILAEFQDHFLTLVIEARDLDKVIRLGITLANVAESVLVLLDNTLPARS